MRLGRLFLPSLILFLAPEAPAFADYLPQPASSFNANAEAGVGYESQSSPLIRITPEGTLVRVQGLNRLSGSHLSANASGVYDHPFGDTLRLALGGSIHVKRAPSAPDLDFTMASVNPMLRWSVGTGSLGFGTEVERIFVAGNRFRDVSSLHADWTLASVNGSNWVVMGDLSRNRHPGDLSDLDSKNAFVMIRRHVAGPMSHIDALDVELAVSREANRRGFSELSSWSRLFRVGVERKLWDIEWSAEYSIQRARFDESPLENLPARRDRGTTFQIAGAYELVPGHSIKMGFTSARNRANLPLYDFRYGQTILALSSAW